MSASAVLALCAQPIERDHALEFADQLHVTTYQRGASRLLPLS